MFTPRGIYVLDLAFVSFRNFATKRRFEEKKQKFHLCIGSRNFLRCSDEFLQIVRGTKSAYPNLEARAYKLPLSDSSREDLVADDQSTLSVFCTRILV